VAGKSKRRSPRNYRFRKAKEDACAFLENRHWKPDEGTIQNKVELIIGKWDLADEPGIEQWLRMFMLLECDKRWKVPPEMPEVVRAEENGFWKDVFPVLPLEIKKIK
jgi:hypothetical protein